MRLLPASALALIACAACAAEPQAVSETMRIYNGLVKISSGRTYQISTNGTAAVKFVGSLFDGYDIWNPQLQTRLSQIPESKICITSTMVGDRVDFSVRGKLPGDTRFGEELAAVKPVAPGLLRYIPSNASLAYISAVPGDSPLEGHMLVVRARFVEQLRALMPGRATYRDFAMFAAPARKGAGIAVVFVFRLASAVPPLDSLEGKKVASLFTIAKAPDCDSPPPEGFCRYQLTSSFKDALGGPAGQAEEMLRFGAAANGVMGPMTMECTCRDGFVFFDIGPAGDLADRLDRPEAGSFNVQSLVPLQHPDLKSSSIRSAVYSSPSAVARRAIAGLGPLLKPVLSGLAQDGDGFSGVVAVLPSGEFLWGWSATRSELEAMEKNEGVAQNAFKTILMQAVHMRAFGGRKGGGQ